jgi:uncharacterized paraquat-inducible protein A
MVYRIKKLKKKEIIHCEKCGDKIEDRPNYCMTTITCNRCFHLLKTNHKKQYNDKDE